MSAATKPATYDRCKKAARAFVEAWNAYADETSDQPDVISAGYAPDGTLLVIAIGSKARQFHDLMVADGIAYPDNPSRRPT